MNCISILFIFSFLHTIFSNQEIILTSANYFHHIDCMNKFSIKINSIRFFYNQYNCIVNLHDHEHMNICLNQSSCRLNLKPILFTHIRYYKTKCRKIKLKSIRLNYTCVNETFAFIKSKKNYSIFVYTKNTIILCVSIISFFSLLALFCSYLQYFLRTSNDSDYDQNKQEYELKNLLVIESSSTSTLTSLNNKNIITNPSEYDNLIKNISQSSEHLSPLKVKLNENY